jgi:hypothetical protein
MPAVKPEVLRDVVYAIITKQLHPDAPALPALNHIGPQDLDDINNAVQSAQDDATAAGTVSPYMTVAQDFLTISSLVGGGWGGNEHPTNGELNGIFRTFPAA